MYQSWYKDQEEEFKTYKDLALFLGHFVNPKMASDFVKSENPQFSVSEEDFEKSTEAIKKVGDMKELQKVGLHRRRRQIS